MKTKMSNTSLIMIAIIGWGVGSIFYRVAAVNISPIITSAIITAIYIILTPLAFIFFKIDTTLNAAGIWASILGGLCMCAGTLGYFYALRNGGEAGATTILTSLYPALTLLLSALFLHETISFKQGIGMCFAVISFLLMSIK